MTRLKTPQSENKFTGMDTDRLLTDSDTAVLGLQTELIFAKAVNLARSGRYIEVESLLQPVMQKGNPPPAVLDLLARIRAQQGRLAEAQVFWSEAIRMNPDEQRYQAGLQRVAAIGKHLWMMAARKSVIILGTVLILAMIGFGIAFFLKELTVKNVKVNSVNVIIHPLVVKFDLPGVNVANNSKTTIITFSNGLFIHGAQLKPEAKALLTKFALQLKPYVGKIVLRVEGHTDDLPIMAAEVFRDNVSLGMQRAAAVVEHLRLAGNLPAEMFMVSSIGESKPLYHNNSQPNRFRNRTVIIWIIPANE